MNMIKRTMKRSTAAATMAVAISTVSVAHAETFIIPSLSVTEIYDDNIFFDSSEKISDRITRLSPGLQVGYYSRKLNFGSSFTFDAERYSDNDSQNSDMTRKYGDVEFEYKPDSRLSLFADAHYTKSDTPEDISIRTGGIRQGLLIARATAEQTRVRPGLSYRFRRDLQGSLAYSQIDEKLIGTGESETRQFEAELVKTLSKNNDLSAGYTANRYQFELDAAGNSPSGQQGEQETKIPWLGLRHRLGPRTSVAAKAGPRLSDDTSGAFLLASLSFINPTLETKFEYERSETTVLGDFVVLEYDSYSVDIAKKIGPRYEINFSPNYTKISQDNSSIDIYRVFLEGKYKVNNFVYLSVTVDSSVQKDHAPGGSADTLKRNVFQLSVTFIYPPRRKGVEDYGD